jgi:uncharacterized protein YecE (DUF72 family)
MPELFAGSSGFAYPSWKPGFYPQKLPSKKFLEHYATRLNCVESNYTFRRMPTESVMEHWVASTPAGFVFAVKAPMRITHILRLRGAEESVKRFFAALNPLHAAGRLGPVLFQLPPRFRCDPALLGDFLDTLPRRLRYTFEFRDPTWFTEGVYDILRRHDAAFCQAESEKLETPEAVTAGFVYRRLRLPEYTDEDLRRIGTSARQSVAGGRDVYLIFKHEETPAGALYAERVLQKTRAAA